MKYRITKKVNGLGGEMFLCKVLIERKYWFNSWQYLKTYRFVHDGPWSGFRTSITEFSTVEAAVDGARWEECRRQSLTFNNSIVKEGNIDSSQSS
jgi:hypothetical protein